MSKTLTAAVIAAIVAVAAGCGPDMEAGGGQVDEAEVPPVVTTTAAADPAPDPEPELTPAPTTAAPTTAPPTTTTAARGSYANPDTGPGPFSTDEVSITITGLGWQTDVSAYNYFDEELCGGEIDIFGDGCEVVEGKGVLVLSYDVTRLAGEPDSFWFDHELITGAGLVVSGSGLHCVGAETVSLAPGGTAPHETCFVVDIDQIGDEAQVGLSVGFGWGDPYWVLVPVNGSPG